MTADSGGNSMKRRDFLKYGAMTGAATLMPWDKLVTSAFAAPAPTSPNLTKYLDALPVPATLPAASSYQIAMTQFKQQLHSQLPPTSVWGYGGTYPGPTIEAHKGQPISVNWLNKLPTKHLLRTAIDPTVHGAETSWPEVRNVVHLHGIKVMPEFDGYPEAWWTPTGQMGPDFQGTTYQYPNDQQATTLWYHDHALGITRLNVYTGLAGFYLIRDNVEANLGLPSGKYEIPLLIQDRQFNADGSLFYPTEGVTSYHPVWSPEWFGDTALVNGKVWPHLEVEARRYRFRMLNGCGSRVLRLYFDDPDVQFNVIGTDGGFLGNVATTGKLLMAPAERCDVVIDFSHCKPGTLIQMMNNAKAPFPSGTGQGLPQIMQFRVVSAKGVDTSTPVAQLALPAVKKIAESTASITRDVSLNEIEDPVTGNPIVGKLENLMWDDPVTINPKAGSTEIWRFVNATPDTHPIHVHLVQFQILDRRPFDIAAYNATGQINFTGAATAPDPEESGWKDTVRVNVGTVTRVIHKFELPKGANVFSGQKLRYVTHCHILEHEDNEMMRPYDVIVP
jgi:spore coat protein A, manganese oxidase